MIAPTSLPGQPGTEYGHARTIEQCSRNYADHPVMPVINSGAFNTLPNSFVDSETWLTASSGIAQ